MASTFKVKDILFQVSFYNNDMKTYENLVQQCVIHAYSCPKWLSIISPLLYV